MIHGAQFDTDLVMTFIKSQHPIIIIVNIIIYWVDCVKCFIRIISRNPETDYMM